MNVENKWIDNINTYKVEGAVKRIEVKEVFEMNHMKIGKAGGSSGVAIELFKAVGDKCLKYLTNIFNNILFKDKLEWMLSSLVPIFKGKGDPHNPNSYRGIKLLEHTFKLYEKVLDGCLHEVVVIDKIQYGFVQGKGTVDAVFFLRRFRGKFRANNGWGFVDLEQAISGPQIGQWSVEFKAKADGKTGTEQTVKLEWLYKVGSEYEFHGLIAQLVRMSEQNSVTVGSNQIPPRQIDKIVISM